MTNIQTIDILNLWFIKKWLRSELILLISYLYNWFFGKKKDKQVIFSSQ